MKQYVVDAFTDRVFHGNQAAVCVLNEWMSEELMMNITRENNFSETAFTVKEGEKWHLRWFTPGGEIDLCGHATLGTAFVLLNYCEKDAQQVVFTTLSGDLIVSRKGGLYEMEFPAYELKKADVTAVMEDALGAPVREAWLARVDARAVLLRLPAVERAAEPAVRDRAARPLREQVVVRRARPVRVRHEVANTIVRLLHAGVLDGRRVHDARDAVSVGNAVLEGQFARSKRRRAVSLPVRDGAINKFQRARCARPFGVNVSPVRGGGGRTVHAADGIPAIRAASTGREDDIVGHEETTTAHKDIALCVQI